MGPEYLNGGVLIPSWLLEMVVHDLVPEHRRQLTLKEGKQLLEQAERGGLGLEPPARFASVVAGWGEAQQLRLGQ
ncbi:hypothetical protein ACGFMM_34305 [Streptomyces sp. NPDC048604]|uniref:hypothetical protein n=1 Tax=Streptomyces sp. NPDC048604 TaxID=3365578 RepID=UPI0037123670